MIAGIDYSTLAVDVVLLDDDTDDAVWHRVRLDTGPGGAFDRTRRVRDAMPSRGAWNDSGVVMAAIEDPRGQQKGASPLFRVQGAVLACLPVELPLVPLPPYEWRQACGLAGNAPKEKVASWARSKWRNEPPGCAQDAYDAYCIAWAVRALAEKAAAKAAAA